MNKFYRLSAALLLAVCATPAAVLITDSVPDSFTGSVQFVQNATLNYDYMVHEDLPEGFGDAEFTLKVAFLPSQVSTIGQTASSPGIRENWANETAEPGDSSSWWFAGNFLLDGHNNNLFLPGTNSLQFYNSGYVRWTFDDGDAGIPTGSMWGIQNSSGTNVLDGEQHVIHIVRRWSGVSDADLELWVDAVLQDTVTSGSRTDMAANYWDNWTNYLSGQEGWFWGVEKQAALQERSDYADYKGLVYEIAFYNGALSSTDISNDQGVVLIGHVDYADHVTFSEGSGTTATSEQGIVMDLINPGDFWGTP